MSSVRSAPLSRGTTTDDMARPAIDRGEWGAVLKLCRRKAETEDVCEYFFRYELDGERRLKNLFWADTDSVIDANLMGYGDVVVFDTTCRTNKHGVAFVPFVGLSHHRSPVVLGCGVTSDQSPDWLLRAFNQSNHRRNGPVSVITDDSDAVAEAVKTVFPGSNHRFCSSHVEQGIEEHLGRGGGSAAAQNEFGALMCDHACSPAAFRDRWYRFLAKHQTTTNQRWLDAMYAKRKMWAAAFVHGKFFLGMANDQRTECLGTPLHTGLREGMSLPDLWRHADACAQALRGNVAALDDQAAMSRMELTTDAEHRCLEEHAARLFTPANFYLLREEIEMMGSFSVVAVIESRIPNAKYDDLVIICMYTVAFSHCPGVTFRVTRRSGDVLKCSCRKMERDGLPCRHIFCVMSYTSMSQIPACCAPRRMTRRLDAKIERLKEMNDLGRQVFDLASEDAQEFQEIKDFFETWLEEKERPRGPGAVVAVVEDNAADAESRSSTYDVVSPAAPYIYTIW